MRARQRSNLLVFACLAFFLGSANVADARPKKSPAKLIFSLAQVDMPKSAPEGLEALIRAKFSKMVLAQPELLDSIPADAPPMDASDTDRRGNKRFRKYMKKHNMRPYRVTLQVTEVETTVKDNTRVSGKLVSANIRVHMFGETLPFRTMAFTGDGSAKIAIEVGKKVRDKDKRFAIEDSAEFAIKQAIEASLQKLNSQKKKTRKKQR